MNRFLLLLLVLFLILCSKSGNDLSGTATDVNSGSIAGIISNDGNRYEEEVDVSLYKNGSGLAKSDGTEGDYQSLLTTSDGSFRFDSLPAGDYSIRISKDSIVIGEYTDISVPAGETVNITVNVTIVIYQTFNITYMNSQENVTINNYYFIDSDGMLDTNTNGEFVASFSGNDTVYITAEIQDSSSVDTVNIAFARQEDGSYIHIPDYSDTSVSIVDISTTQLEGSGSDSSDAVIDGEISENPEQSGF